MILRTSLAGMLSLVFSLVLGCGVGRSSTLPAPNPAHHSLAQSLNAQGQQELLRGQPEQALLTWQRATEAYQQINDEHGTIGTLFNQARALEELGRYEQACKKLLMGLEQHGDCNFADPGTVQGTVQDTDQNSADDRFGLILHTLTSERLSHPLQMLGLQSFGNLLRLLGHLDHAEIVFEQSQHLAGDPLEMSRSLSGSGRVAENKYRSAKNLYERAGFWEKIDAQKATIAHAYEALNFYDRAITLAQTDSGVAISLQTQLLRLKHLIDWRQWLKATDSNSSTEIERLTVLINTQVLALQQSAIDDLPQSRMAIYLNLDLAETLMQLHRQREVEETGSKRLTTISHHHTEVALQHARELHDRHSQSYSLGLLGYLHELNQEWELAHQSTQAAFKLAENLQSLELAYQWQWQLARIYAAMTKREQAIEAYEGAIVNLDIVRKDLLTLDKEIQFSFRERVEPVYRQFINLLLQQDTLEQKSLQQATEVLAKLQIAELENFLNCDLSQILEQTGDEQAVDPTVALIHTIVLEDQLVVILQPPQTQDSQAQELHHHVISIPEEQIAEILVILRRELEHVYLSPEGLRASQQLYDWLIRPFETTLASTSVQTLAFALDSPLQGIPMAVLHDGEDYLIEQGYAITLVSSLQPANPQLLAQPSVLAFGLSKIRENSPDHHNFAPLHNVEMELAQIPTQMQREKRLNEAFTQDEFQTVVSPTSVPIVHLATHGQFSSIPENTFMLAWDKRLGIDDFVNVLRSRSQHHPIELLILSACQTAEGDSRATLGLAGITIQSGARSTIASLWVIDDESTAILMRNFYQSLATGKVSTAEALRQAQVKLMQRSGYRSPRFWAPFVLIGNWL